jgi:transcriptional regulator with XRE-family HTH domain
MKFRSLQDNLRKTLRERIEEGNLTGLQLARDTGFRQAHISNFLNKKRGLSVDGMDRVLRVQKLSVLDLLDPAEVNRRASLPPPSGDEFQNVRLVSGAVAATQPAIPRMNVREIFKFRKSFLRKLRPEMEGNRSAWERFVLIQPDGAEGMSLYPRLVPGAVVLVDRHYNSLRPYRKSESNLYAVLKDGACIVRYVDLSGRHLVLRPHNPIYHVEVLPIDSGKKAGDYLIGRICYIGTEA